MAKIYILKIKNLQIKTNDGINDTCMMQNLEVYIHVVVKTARFTKIEKKGQRRKLQRNNSAE